MEKTVGISARVILISVIVLSALASYIPFAVTSGTDKQRIESARIACGVASSVTAQSGSWISSMTNGTTGVCTVNIASGIFSVAPRCVCSSADGTARICTINGTPSTSSVPITHRNSSSNAQADAGDIELICTGTR